MSIKQTLLSSIGQKILVATSGLVMFLLFLLPHMGGNILILFGKDLFNSYAMHLHDLKPLLILVELIMVVSITIHMGMAIRLVLANNNAKSKRRTNQSSKERSLAARLMPISGSMIFIFIIKHLLDFKLYEKSEVMLNGHLVEDVYSMVLTRFQDPVHTAFYVLFMVAVGLHLSHALQSAIQTLGFYVPRKESKIKLISTLIAIGMASTFAIIPIVAYLR